MSCEDVASQEKTRNGAVVIKGYDKAIMQLNDLISNKAYQKAIDKLVEKSSKKQFSLKGR